MSKKRLNAKELVIVTKGTAGKNLVKIVVLIATVHVVVKVVGKVIDKMNQVDKASEEDENILRYSVIFNGRNIKVEDEIFKGAIINNICGGFKLDLGSARIEEDVDIHCKNLMSGFTLIVPEKVNVNITGKSIMSGVASNVPKLDAETAPTIHIYADNLMSGMEVKVKNPCCNEGCSKYCDQEIAEESAEEITEEFVEEISEESAE